jgi:hypothetical protein
MPNVLDERTLCARFKSWIDAELSAHPYGALTRAETEVRAQGTKTRHDLLIYAGNKPVFSCEVKLPTSAEGASPYEESVVEGARRKAEAESVAFFGTFNCMAFVIWQVEMPGVPVGRRDVLHRRVVEPQFLTHLESAQAEEAFKRWVRDLLTLIAAADAGAPLVGPEARRPETEFVSRIEGSLETIVGLTLPDVSERFTTNASFRRSVKQWMIADQHWQWDDTQGAELLLQTVKIACYLQMNRIMFYLTMRSRFPDLPELDLTAAKSGAGISRRLEPLFARAMHESSDYETVFEVGYIVEVGYASDAATHAWSGLVQLLKGFDLSALGLDVLGGIFERLLSPEERHRFGQHYTNPQLVDILIAAAVKDRDAVVLDPASGGGTFLVRAYERLRNLGERDHLVLLSQIYGNDPSRFAGHLSTINLAARQILREENYPRVGTHDFFQLKPGDPLVHLPVGPGPSAPRSPIALPGAIDAIVGNPPYIRRQSIDAKTRKSAKEAVVSFAHEAGTPHFKVDGLSDLYVYFWPQASRFLADGGYIAFLTSSAWLQSRYGAQLKQLLLQEYDIELVAETVAEPWFSDARVKTVATIARKRPRSREVADEHEVAFAQIQSPLADLLGSATANDRWHRVEALLAEMRTPQDGEHLRVRLVQQADLGADDDWSIPLRAPRLYLRFVELPGVVTVCSEEENIQDPYALRVGPKFGSKWFVVHDVSDSTSDEELRDWSVTRKQVSAPSPRFRIVSGQDWRGPVEARYLKRWVRGPGDETSRELGRQRGDLVVTVSRDTKIPRTAKLWEYIRHGEELGEHKRVYTGARQKWYCIEDMRPGPIIYPSGTQYGHKVWGNPGERYLTTSPNAYLEPRDASNEVALALLNSTWTYLAALFDAGTVGTEGLVRFGGRGSWRRLHSIDPRRASAQQAARLAEIWKRLGRATVEQFPPEGNEPLSGHRRELDELALSIAGVGDPVEASELVDELYAWLVKFNSKRADVEGMAVSGRTAGRSGARIQNIVEQTVAALEATPPWVSEVDELWSIWDLPEEAAESSGQASLLGLDNGPERPTDIRFGDEWVRFDAESQAEFVRTLASNRMAPRRLAVPPSEIAASINEAAMDYIDGRRKALRSGLSERIGEDDPAFPEAFVRALSRLSAADRAALYTAARHRRQVSKRDRQRR